MPLLKRYRIFISHAWTYNASYYRLVEMLDSMPNFHWENYSVPEDAPLPTKTKRELNQALINQIKPTNIIIILAGMYVNYREWIEREINIADDFQKPIIGIVPRGAQVTPLAVSNVARIMVGWNTNSIIDAIRRYAI
ncbi:hypothetical protein LCGC14_2558880 [marine sediment metagenome]|uniref:Thoeris protein ThsB TIR-like domain-containing protein n=1 Tax=marine sediment metagenome TaxID=412755 RepID=A0A0F9DDP9_9ZZZZ